MEHETRQWGEFFVLDKGEGYKLKKLIIKPEKSISKQYHTKRGEHWHIIQGEAKVHTQGKLELIGSSFQSLEICLSGSYVFIPPLHIHKITNIGEDDLIIIELQVGSYLEEDDIIRIQE